jgi:hypothetical protein
MAAEASIRCINKIKYQGFYFQIYFALGCLFLKRSTGNSKVWGRAEVKHKEFTEVDY